MWTYDGWADLSFMGGEVKDPGRTLPLALILGTISIVVVYLLLNFAYIYLVPLAEMAASPLIAATAADRITVFAGAGGAVISGVVMVSCLGALTGSMMTGPRVFFAMADRGLFFRSIARVSPRYQSPSVAIWFATALGVVYVLFNDFQQLADKFILGIWPFYALAVAAVFVLRRTRPDLERPYRTWGYPVVPLLFLLASVGMVLNALWTDPVNTGITFGIILTGVPVYLVWRARGGAAKHARGRDRLELSSRAKRGTSLGHRTREDPSLRSDDEPSWPVYTRTSIPRSAARTLCVSAPTETKSTPASAYARTLPSVIPPVASISSAGRNARAFAAHSRTVCGDWLSIRSRVAPAATASSSCAIDSTSTCSDEIPWDRASASAAASPFPERRSACQ